MFYQIFLSPPVKRWVIITYKHGIYDLPHKLPKESESFVDTSRKLLKKRNETFPVVRYFTCKIELVSNILRVIVGYEA